MLDSKNNYKSFHYDLVIIGAGGSGLMTAIEAKNKGVKRIAVISKVNPLNSHTGAAKGGINAALGNVESDDWRWHLYDTIKGSDGLADHDASEILCKNAKAAIEDLERYGVRFSRLGDGKIAQRKYGGQRLNYGKGDLAYRSCYSKDHTGKTILDSLYKKARECQIEFFNEFFIFDLLVSNGQCGGCLAYSISTGEFLCFNSNNTVIATGGFSQIYHTTTSAAICNGDGTALAFKNNLVLQDMEFTQFHPSGIAGKGFLITEAARAEGGYLVNSEGLRFMESYDPEMMELSSRDIISRAIANEISQGRGVGPLKNGVYLDLRHLKESIFTEKIPGVVEIAKNFANTDVTKSCLVIAPSAHYSMGGVSVDLDCQVVDSNDNKVVGLYAVGESSCLSVHGANRLGCNSLLELIVFGKVCANHVANNNINTLSFDSIATEKVEKFIKELNIHINEGININFEDVRNEIRLINEKYLAIFRSEEKMNIGISKLMRAS